MEWLLPLVAACLTIVARLLDLHKNLRTGRRDRRR